MEDNFKLEIISPEKIIFLDNVNMVTLPSYEGDMSVLKRHISIITFLRPGIIKIQKNEKYRFLHLREVGVPSRNIVHGRGVGSKSRIRVERIVGSSCAQSAREKYKLIRGTAKKALLKHLLVTGPSMRIVQGPAIFG